MRTILHNTLDDFRSGRALEPANAENFLDALITETDEGLIARVLGCWHEKGIEEIEILSIANIMRGRMKRVNSQHLSFVDIVGTGGSWAKTFNVSTAAAFVVAGAGTPVAKHGNKAATSNSGSTDVLAELGLDATASPETAERHLNDIGICFMFAPNFHSLSPTLGKVRRSFPYPTVFNCVGPLCNPAAVPHQLIGAWDRGIAAKMASALAMLGTERSWVVNGNDGLDEISLTGPTSVFEVRGSSVSEFTVEPGDFGCPSASLDKCRAANAPDSARVIREVISGSFENAAARDLVLINSAAALMLAGGAEDLGGAASIARKSIDSGKALAKLRALAVEGKP